MIKYMTVIIQIQVKIIFFTPRSIKRSIFPKRIMLFTSFRKTLRDNLFSFSRKLFIHLSKEIFTKLTNLNSYLSIYKLQVKCFSPFFFISSWKFLEVKILFVTNRIFIRSKNKISIWNKSFNRHWAIYFI